MFNFKKKSHLSVELNDYVLRGLVKKGPAIEQWQIVEIALPHGVISEASIVDEMGLYEILKENVQALGGKNQAVRIFVPDTSVLLKTFEHPEDVETSKLSEYVQMELGRSIHLPFQEPLVDVYDPTPNDGQAVLFAVPPDEVGKFVGVLQDVNLQPEVADIRALCNLRLLEHIQLLDAAKTYLIADWSINELSICIYTNGHVEFLRYQSVETDISKWQVVDTNNGIDFEYEGDLQEYMIRINDQVLELDRILNFFKFSLHKGEKTVDEMIMIGDNPHLHEISELITENISTPLLIVDDAIIEGHYPNFKAKHASLIGLALKEV
jgi:type IV pilus assembly protein PilM